MSFEIGKADLGRRQRRRQIGRLRAPDELATVELSATPARSATVPSTRNWQENQTLAVKAALEATGLTSICFDLNPPPGAPGWLVEMAYSIQRFDKRVGLPVVTPAERQLDGSGRP